MRKIMTKAICTGHFILCMHIQPPPSCNGPCARSRSSRKFSFRTTIIIIIKITNNVVQADQSSRVLSSSRPFSRMTNNNDIFYYTQETPSMYVYLCACYYLCTILCVLRLQNLESQKAHSEDRCN